MSIGCEGGGGGKRVESGWKDSSACMTIESEKGQEEVVNTSVHLKKKQAQF